MEGILRSFSENKRWSRKMFKKPSAAEAVEMLVFSSVVGVDLNLIPFASRGVLGLKFAYSDMEVCQ